MPKPFAFEPGTCYVLDGVGYAIVSLLDDEQLLARNLMTQAKQSVSIKHLRQRWKAGHFRFAFAEDHRHSLAGQPLKTRYLFTDLSFLPRPVQYETWLRYTIIRPLVDVTPKERPRSVVLQRVAAVIAAYLEWIIPHDQEAVLTRLGGKEWWRQYELEAPPQPAQDLLALLEQTRQEGLSLRLFSAPWVGVSERSVYRWMPQF